MIRIRDIVKIVLFKNLVKGALIWLLKLITEPLDKLRSFLLTGESDQKKPRHSGSSKM